MKKLFYTVMAILLSFGLTPVKAQYYEPTTDNQTRVPQVQNIQTQEIKGRITKITDRILTIDTGSESRSVDVPQDVRITRNSQAARFEDLAVNDQVTVTADQNGQILDISATAGNVADTSQVLAPAVILLILLLGAAYYFISRANKGHIKTTTTTKES